MKKTETMIRSLDKYLALMRFNYTNQEKLSRLNIINDYYASNRVKPSTEVLQVPIESAEQLSGELVLPLKVRGVFLTEGKPKARWYSADSLKESVSNPVNKTFPLMLDHEDSKASKVIGKVDKIEYDDSIKGIRWWGHINDETFARNVLDGVITDVSVTVYSGKLEYGDNGLEGLDLTFKELSLVMSGSEPDNFIQVDV